MDWKKKIKDSCPCFMKELGKPTPSHEPCGVSCNLEDLKLLLLQNKVPDRSQIVKTMVKSGIFTKKEIIFALVEIHDTIYKSAERRVEENIVALKNENYKVFTDENKVLKAWKQ